MKVGVGRKVEREHRDLIRALLSSEGAGYLSDWEEEFLSNIQKLKFLSDKQMDTLERIDSAVERRSTVEYDDESW